MSDYFPKIQEIAAPNKYITATGTKATFCQFDISAPRRFPPPWSVEELNDACFLTLDRAPFMCERVAASLAINEASDFIIR
jgi:hypothetical protein